MIRVPGYCVHPYNDTTVLCHYRLGACGIGMKPDDALGAWGCHVCHDIVDGRMTIKEWSRTEIRLMHAEGVLRTQDILRKERH